MIKKDSRKKRLKKVYTFLLGITCLTAPVFVNASSNIKHSAFIEGPVQFEKNPKRVGSYRYINPAAKLASYTKIAVDPIEFWIDPDSDYKGINPDDLKLIADMFRHVLTDELEPAYPVVSKAGQGVLYIRLALTNVKLKKKSRGLLGFTPVGLALNATKDLFQKIKLLDAVIEVELLDATTGKRLAVLVDQNIHYDASGAESWESMKRNLSFYAKRLKEHLDASRHIQ